MSDVKILATGPKFLKEGVRGTGPVIEEIIKNSEKEIQILAYVISFHASKFLDFLEDALKRNVRVVVLNKFEEQDEKIKRKMKKLYQKLVVIDFTDPNDGDLHAKVIVVDRKKAVIGSANFSWHGMSHNYEIGVQLEGNHAWKLGKIIDDIEEKFSPDDGA